MPSPTFISGLLYPRMKTSRAGEHLQFINDEWARFQADNPYTVTEKDDPEKGLHIVSVKLKPGNGHIPIVVGEFAYALRSALDQLVWQLALLSGKRPGNKSSFPIQSGDGDIDRQRFIHATWNLPCDAISIIKELQPYVRGKASKTHPLWQLNKLCNLDKHATIGISHTLVNIKTSGPPGPIYVRQVVTTADSHAEVSFPIGLKGDVQIEPLPPSLVVVKPDEAPGPEFTLPADGLTEIHRFVRDEVLPRFIKFFPANGAFIVGKP